MLVAGVVGVVEVVELVELAVVVHRALSGVLLAQLWAVGLIRLDAARIMELGCTNSGSLITWRIPPVHRKAFSSATRQPDLVNCLKSDPSTLVI